jgi:hypothetical protein
MPEAGNLETIATKVAKAHDPLLEVLVGDHESEVEKVGGCVADEEDATFSGEVHHVTFRVAGRVDDRDPSPHRDLVPVFNQDVGFHWADGGWFGSDHPSKEERVEDARRREQGTHGSAFCH